MNPRISLSTYRGSGHPWIFRRMIAKDTEKTPNGAAVDVYDRDERFVGVGLVSLRSQIAIRIVSFFEGREVDAPYLAERFADLRDLREQVLRIPARSNAYRLVNSEGDGLSGLILDKFGNNFVADLRAYGWYVRRAEIETAVKQVFGEQSKFHVTTAPGVDRQEGFSLPAPASDATMEFDEHGIQYRVRLAEAHKTGFFLDQRDSRATLSTICEGKKVLDCCCYTGGFSLNAVRGGAEDVTGVDLDEDSIAAAKRNAGRNNAKCKFIHADAFPYMRDRMRTGNLPDIIILDPPKLIKSRETIEEGRLLYFDLNRTAISTLPKGGMLFTFSCSGLMSEEGFLKVLSEAAFVSGKSFQVLRITGASPDHPYLLNAPETRYLKGVLGRVL